MDSIMKTVLLTWWLGFIGSHTACYLLEQGIYELVLLDNLSRSSQETYDAICRITNKKPALYIGDIADAELIDSICKAHTIDAVVHFAAYKNVWESCLFPFLYYHNNINASLLFFEALEKNDVNKIVFSSSCTVYDEHLTPLPYRDTDKGLSWHTSCPYATTKKIIEQVLYDLTQHSDFSAVTLRYFNPIWAHPSGSLWEDIYGDTTNLLPVLLQSLLWMRDQVTVFWNDYETRDGTCIRDYIHIMDLAKAHALALEYLLKEQLPQHYQTFNIGTSVWVTVLELITIVEQVTQKKIPYSIGSRRFGDVAARYADIAKAQHILKRTPEFSVEDAVRDAWMYVTHE